jgi:L,D-transpeptidase ErfK/SrfK
MNFFLAKRNRIVAAIAGAVLLPLVAFFIWKKISEDRKNDMPPPVNEKNSPLADTTLQGEPPLALIPVAQPVSIGQFFHFVDDVVEQYDTLTPYDLTEHLLVRANSWIIDTLENTDYYRQMARGNFVFNQRVMTVLRPGDTLRLPGQKTAAALLSKMKNTRLDVNIPAFQLRIIEGDSVLYTFPIRVGKNQEKFLALVGQEVDLRTRTGIGEIIRISRDPIFFDPVTGEKFEFTKRDDRKTTRMPLIPWLEPSLDGKRYGQMIHPTTNPLTLGKTSSNGCIGLKEADAWRVYYYAPVGTKVVVRYDLLEINEKGDTLRFNDVYQLQHRKKKSLIQAALLPLSEMAKMCWCEP